MPVVQLPGGKGGRGKESELWDCCGIRIVGRTRDNTEAIFPCAWALQPCNQNLSLRFPRCGIVKRLFGHSVPQFPHK